MAKNRISFLNAMHLYRSILYEKFFYRKIRIRSSKMAEILVVLFGVIFGGLPTLYLIWEAFATIGQKVYRKVKFGISMFD